MITLTEILNNPEEHYPGNFDTPQRANALLTGLCQDASAEINRLVSFNQQLMDEVARLQKREWVGLTNEEVENYYDWEDFQCGCGRGTLFEMVRDIEAKLKEKNT